jgi:hypothetical protein
MLYKKIYNILCFGSKLVYYVLEMRYSTLRLCETFLLVYPLHGSLPDARWC